MATGLRLARHKRLALANCNGLLIRACDELDAAMGRGSSRGLQPEDVDDLGPLAQRVIELRRRRRRLEAELHAIAAEWDDTAWPEQPHG
ncbi:MAG TPA: hypothetical protein VF066_15580 [Thermoleophilaceae bacterium]